MNLIKTSFSTMYFLKITYFSKFFSQQDIFFKNLQPLSLLLVKGEWAIIGKPPKSFLKSESNALMHEFNIRNCRNNVHTQVQICLIFLPHTFGSFLMFFKVLPHTFLANVWEPWRYPRLSVTWVSTNKTSFCSVKFPLLHDQLYVNDK